MTTQITTSLQPSPSNTPSHLTIHHSHTSKKRKLTLIDEEDVISSQEKTSSSCTISQENLSHETK